MKYFSLADDQYVAGRWHLGELYLENDQPLYTAFDKPLPQGRSLRTEITCEGSPLDFNLTSFAMPVARAQIAEAIARFADSGFRHIPVEVPGFSGFEILSAIETLKCFDEARTDYFEKWMPEDGLPERVGEYAIVLGLKILSSQVPQDLHIFRIEGWTVELIISEKVKEAMEEVGCIGARFVDVT